MKIGFVGLGKMGGNMSLRLVQGSPDGSVRGGHEVVGYARDPNPALKGVKGITVVPTLEAVVQSLAPPRVVWVMVPAGNPTEDVIAQLAELLRSDDLIIDGGNSYYKDSIRRAEGLSKRGIGFLDVGTSGGIWGREEGYCLMIGGAEEDVRTVSAIFDTLAPKNGWAHVGTHGAGHFVKIAHNAVEYGLMESYGEGSSCCANQTSISIFTRSPPCGIAAASCVRGCSSWPSRCSRLKAICERFSRTWKIAVKDAGRWRRRWKKRSPSR